MRKRIRFKTEYRTLGGRNVKVSVPATTITKEEFDKRITEILKKAIEREKKS